MLKLEQNKSPQIEDRNAYSYQPFDSLAILLGHFLYSSLPPPLFSFLCPKFLSFFFSNTKHT